MSFIFQVIAIYLGILVLLAVFGALVSLATKYKIEPLSGAMVTAFGLLLITAGVIVWRLVERKP